MWDILTGTGVTMINKANIPEFRASETDHQRSNFTPSVHSSIPWIVTLFPLPHTLTSACTTCVIVSWLLLCCFYFYFVFFSWWILSQEHSSLSISTSMLTDGLRCHHCRRSWLPCRSPPPTFLPSSVAPQWLIVSYQCHICGSINKSHSSSMAPLFIIAYPQ